MHLKQLDKIGERFDVLHGGVCYGRVVFNEFEEGWQHSDDNYKKRYSTKEIAANGLITSVDGKK